MAPVVKACKARPELDVKVCVTAQHRQMLDQVMEIFGLTADFDLNVMAPNQTLGDVTCKVLKGMESVFAQWRPDMILVQGDTTTVMAAALAAFYHKIAIGHVEAGLRTATFIRPGRKRRIAFWPVASPPSTTRPLRVRRRISSRKTRIRRLSS